MKYFHSCLFLSTYRIVHFLLSAMHLLKIYLFIYLFILLFSNSWLQNSYSILYFSNWQYVFYCPFQKMYLKVGNEKFGWHILLYRCKFLPLTSGGEYIELISLFIILDWRFQIQWSDLLTWRILSSQDEIISFW